MKKTLLILGLFVAAMPAFGQQVPIKALVTAPNGPVYAFGTGRANIVCPGNQAPTYNGFTVPRTITIPGFDGFGQFGVQSPMVVYDVNALQPVGCAYTFAICDQTGAFCFTTQNIGGATQSPVITGSTLVDLSAAISAFAVPLPLPSSTTLNVNSVPVINANLGNSPTITWQVTGSTIQATCIGCGAIGGGSNVQINGVGTTTVSFNSNSSVSFSLVGGAVTAIAIAAGSEGGVQFNHSGQLAAVAGVGVDSVTSPTSFLVPLNLVAGGPNPYFDVSSSLYGAVGNATINTTGTGSGTSLTVGVSTFKNGMGITIAQAGAAPAINTPTNLAVTPGAAAGLTVPDALMVAGMAGTNTCNYRIFAHDILGGTTQPTSTVSITNCPNTLGENQFAVSTWSLTGTTLSIVTSAVTGLPKDAKVHITGTSNNALGGGWYPISTISGTTLTVNNVPQYSATTVSGTGGNLVAMVGNKLTWTKSTGGTLGTVSAPWDYFVCAQRPGDGSFHIIGRSFPSTFYGEQYQSAVFVDFGATLSSNPTVPWYLSDANCTAGAPQNRYFTTTVLSGGGSSALTLTAPMTNAVVGLPVRKDDAPAFNSAAAAAQTAKGSLYIPAGQNFVLNSAVGLPSNVGIWQAGQLTIGETLILNNSTNWYGNTGSGIAPAFAFNGAPQTTCNAYPCVYVGAFGAQSIGANTYYNLSLTSAQNGLLMLVDSGWGQVWDRVNFTSGSGNNDNMGIGLVIRPGAAEYKIRNSLFIGGPNQVIDQTWAPLFYADYPAAGCCGGSGSAGTIDIDNSMWNRRGFYEVASGGSGVFLNVHGAYRQGGITPWFDVQSINGSIAGQVQLDLLQHDTESQAAYAWTCNLGCVAGFGSVSGMAFRLGLVNEVSQDAGTFPSQTTGGGNSSIDPSIGTFGGGGRGVVPAQGWYYHGDYAGGYIYPIGNINMNGTGASQSSFVPNVPTPELTLQSGSFVANFVAGALTGNITFTTPTTGGTLCTTTTCGGQFYQTIDANGTAQTQRPVLNLIAGTNMTVNCVDDAGLTSTDCTLISSSTASTSWGTITAATNNNAGTFTATGNSWNFSGATTFTLPSAGVIIPGSASGSVTLVAQAAAGTPTLTFGTSSGTPAVTASAPLVITAATGNIACATCVTSSGGGAITGTLPIVVSAAGAVSINAATTSTLGSIELTGNLGGTGASPTVIATTITGFTQNFIVKFNSGGNTVNSSATDNGTLFTIPEILDNTTNPYAQEVPNEGVTGTTVNKWASLTGAPSTAKITAHGTTGPVGIVAAGAGIISNAQIAVLGQINCVFDGGTTANHFVGVSASVDGDCTDAGTSAPANTPSTIVLSTNAGAGTYKVVITGGSGGGGSGSGTVNNCGVNTGAIAEYVTSGTAVSCDANITVSTGTLNLGIAGSTAGSLTLSGSSSGTISVNTQAAAGTYNFNLPVTAGTPGYFLTSGGGGTTQMSWTTNSLTINGVNCVVASTCTTLTLNTNGAANASQNVLNFVTSTGNTLGLTITPSNPNTNQEKFEITGITNPTGGGTGITNPTPHSLLVAEGPSAMVLLTSPSVNGNYICGFNVVASTQVDPSCQLIGVPFNTQSTGSYTVGALDRAGVINMTNGGAQSLTATNPTAAGFGTNFAYIVRVPSTGGAVTESSSGFNLNGGTSLLIPPAWAAFHYSDNANYTVERFPDFTAYPDCQDTAGKHVNFTAATGIFSCGTTSSTTGGTVTSVATTSPITGGTFTTSGTIGCATCVTSAAALASGAIMTGGGLQASSTDASATLSGGTLTLLSGGSVVLNGATSGSATISVTATAGTVNLGSTNATVDSSGNLTVVSCNISGGGSCGGVSSGTLSSITAATGANTIANGNFGSQVWNWAQTTASQTAFTFGETTAATGSGDIELTVKTLAGSTAIPLNVTDSLTGSQTLPAVQVGCTWNTTGVVDACLLIKVTNTASGSASLLFDAQVGGTSQFTVDKSGNVTATGTVNGASLTSGSSAPACTAGTAGAICWTEGTAFTNVSGAAGCYPDSTAHELFCATNGSSSFGMLQRSEPGSIQQVNKTALISTATLCAASAGACNVDGMYSVDWAFTETGTACAVPGTGGVTFLLTWTDHNGTTHSAISLPMDDGSAVNAVSGTFHFQTSLAAAWASGSFNIDSNGSVISYATGYTACGTGTGQYTLTATVTRKK